MNLIEVELKADGLLPARSSRLNFQHLVIQAIYNHRHWNSNKNDWQGRWNSQFLHLALAIRSGKRASASKSGTTTTKRTLLSTTFLSLKRPSSSPNDPLRGTPSPWLPHHDRLMRMYNRRSVFPPKPPAKSRDLPCTENGLIYENHDVDRDLSDRGT